MTELENDLNRIKQEKLNKIIPENIKKGVNILGVTGTLEAGGGTPVEGVKQFASIDEMNQSTGSKEGDLAIVYAASIANLTAETEFTKATLPDTVVLLEAFTGNAMIQFQAVDPSQQMECYGNMDSQHMDCEFMSGNPETDYRINYTSADGITYTKQAETPAEIIFDYPIKYGSPWGGAQEWNDAIGYFFQVGSVDFNGLFEFKENVWKIAPTQLNARAINVWGDIFYGPNGVETGTLNNTVDVNAVEIRHKIDIVNDMQTNSTVCGVDMTNMCKNYQGSNIPIKLDTSHVTNMNNMFWGCTNLTAIPELNTTSVTNMDSTFAYCPNLTAIPELNTTSVTNMGFMFSGCKNLTSIPLLDTSNAITTRAMFSRCTNLKSVPQLNTSNVTNMNEMFNDCPGLTIIPELNTSKVTSMNFMFGSCTNLVTVPLLDTSNVTEMGYMFYRCPALSDESLNNILQMCINSKETTKTLARIELSQTQAIKCQSLSNWQAFLDAGWTTGY